MNQQQTDRRDIAATLRTGQSNPAGPQWTAPPMTGEGVLCLIFGALLLAGGCFGLVLTKTLTSLVRAALPMIVGALLVVSSIFSRKTLV